MNLQDTHLKVIRTLRTCKTPIQRQAAERYAVLWCQLLGRCHDEQPAKELRRCIGETRIEIAKEWEPFISNIKSKDMNKSIFSEVYLENHGWRELLSKGEYGTHEGVEGIYYLVDGFGKVNERYCKQFR